MEDKVKENVTVIIGIKNRYDYRIVNALQSLRNQTYSSNLIEIILVDYGSKKNYLPEFNKLCKEYNVNGVWTGTNAEWNRSNCLNIGIRKAKGKYILSSDVDLVFEKNYIATCVKELNKEPKIAVYCKMLDLPKGAIKNIINQNKYSSYKKKGVHRNVNSDFPYGVSILFTRKEYLTKIRGYDEYYRLWGKEDIDLIRRLEGIGVRIEDISLKTSHVHQWHEKYEGVSKKKDFATQVKLNQTYCLYNGSIIRNPGFWGEIPPINNKIRHCKKELPGTIWGLTTFFNPVGYKNKYKNYKLFRYKTKKQGLKLLAVELAFGDAPFELNPDSADILIQLRGEEKNIMWQKERLLTIGLKNLPKNCDKVVWLDCDIRFMRDDWIEQTSKLLREYPVVQPYSVVMRLQKGDVDYNAGLKADVKVLDNKDIYYGFGYQVNKYGEEIIGKEFSKHGHGGFAWAARKEVLDKIGFYDKMLVGSADLFMAKAFCGRVHDMFEQTSPQALLDDEKEWAKKAYGLVYGNIAGVDGVILHMWHGDINNRDYHLRNLILKNNAFDPNKDIVLEKNGLWAWKGDKPILSRAIRKYFEYRNEEGKVSKDALTIVSKAHTKVINKFARVLQKINQKKD
jgi:hypothetical protein